MTKAPKTQSKNQHRWWDGEGGKEAQEGVYICIYIYAYIYTHILMADSHYCMAETNTTL